MGHAGIYITMRKKQRDLSGRTTDKLFHGRELLADSLKLPKDTVLGASILTITGNREIWMENYRGILEYSTEEILLQAKTCQICIEGRNLSIDYYTNEDMKISGCISGIRYL